MQNSSLADDIQAEIVAAFEGVALDNGISLRETGVLDRYGTQEQRKAARALDNVTRWQEISDEEIESQDFQPVVLDAEGFRYYAPAIMTWALRHQGSGEVEGSMTLNSMLVDLAMGFMEGREKFSLLNDAQKRAICRFLRYCISARIDPLNDSTIHVALSYGWGDYCDG